MAFGQASGPPATARQITQLRELMLAAGHVDFRDARGPLGLTQRQAGGKFTRDEADELIERLDAEVNGDPRLLPTGGEGELAPSAHTAPAPQRRAGRSEGAGFLANVDSSVLAAELQRRGWAVIEP